MAYGILGLTPFELFAMTPREIISAVQGRGEYEQAQNQARWYKVAWLTAYLLQPHSKKKLTAEKLLGPKFMAGMKGAAPPPPKLVTTTAREELDSIRRMLKMTGEAHA